MAHNMLSSTLYIMLPINMQCLELLRSLVWEEMHLQEKHYLTFDLDLTCNVSQCPLCHVTYAAAKFEVAMSNGLGGDAFTRKYII